MSKARELSESDLGRKPGGRTQPTTVMVEWDGVEYRVPMDGASLLDAWKARDALRLAGLPKDDELLLTGAMIWVAISREHDVTLTEVLESLTLADLLAASTAAEDPASPEA